MTSTIYSINPKYIFKFDNEFNEMIKNNHFKDYLMESIIALLTILIDKNEYNLNQTTPDNFNFLIKDLKKMEDNERFELLNHTTIFSNKMWLCILYIFRKTNKCLRENCKFSNCLSGFHNISDIACYHNMFFDSGCRKNKCNKIHLVNYNFWTEINNKIKQYNLNCPLINDYKIETSIVFEKTFSSLLSNIEENAKFDSIKNKSFSIKYANKKIKKDKKDDEEVILDYDFDYKGGRAALEVMLLKQTALHEIQPALNVVQPALNVVQPALRVESSNNLQINNTPKIFKKIKKQRIAEMTEEEYQEYVNYQL